MWSSGIRPLGRREWPALPGASGPFAFSGDGTTLVTQESSGNILVWDLKGVGAVQRLVFSVDGQRLVTVGSDRKLIVWNIAGRKELLCFTEHGQAVYSVAFALDGRLAVSAGKDTTIRLWGH